MIIRDKPSPLDLMFALRGSVLPQIAGELGFAVLVATAVLLWDRLVFPLPHLNSTPFALFGVALSLFLGFRNNAAYDRWWEARKLWGALLIEARMMARDAAVFLPDTDRRLALLRLVRGFLHLHRCALRGLAPDAAALRDSAGLREATPEAALDAMAALLAQARADGLLDGFGARCLSQHVAGLTTAQAGNDRIRATPLPFAYSMLVYRTSWLYCLLAPMALISPAGWLTPLFAGVIAYTFFGLAEVTEELVHPFGPTANALPLDAICRSADISLAPHLGETAPPPLLPVNFRLD